ncbi:MAG: hypothetical protein JWQ90_5603 [Hydrocarboniphaga sp.]|nr:hypothetical protein [Hydrocarboniphaga sp.]
MNNRKRARMFGSALLCACVLLSACMSSPTSSGETPVEIHSTAAHRFGPLTLLTVYNALQGESGNESWVELPTTASYFDHYKVRVELAPPITEESTRQAELPVDRISAAMRSLSEVTSCVVPVGDIRVRLIAPGTGYNAKATTASFSRHPDALFVLRSGGDLQMLSDAVRIISHELFHAIARAGSCSRAGASGSEEEERASKTIETCVALDTLGVASRAGSEYSEARRQKILQHYQLDDPIARTARGLLGADPTYDQLFMNDKIRKSDQDRSQVLMQLCRARALGILHT